MLLFLLFVTNLFSTYHKVAEIPTSIASSTYQTIEIKNNLAFVSDREFGLKIYEINSPSNPILISELELDLSITDIVIQDNIVYLLCYEAKMYIVDILDPYNPIILSEYNTQHNCYRFDMNNNFAYIIGSDGFLEVVDISDPEVPLFIIEFSLPYYLTGCAITEELAFISTLTGLYMYDITNPYELQEIYWFDSGNTKAPTINNQLLLYCGSEGLIIIDFSNLDSIQVISMTEEIRFFDMEIRDNKLYCTRGTRVQVIDISNIQSPEIIQTYYSNYCTKIAVKDDFIFTNTSRGWFNIIDVSDPETPEYLSSLDVSDINEIYKSTEDELLILRTNNYETLEFYSMNDPANPEFLYSYDEDGWYCNTFFIDEYIACATFGWRFYIFDLTDPEELIIQGPTSLNYPSPTSWVRCIARKNNYLYLATDNSILIVDVSDMENPNPILDVDINGYIFDLTIKENYMYYVNIGGLQIYDITDPLDPIECGFWDSNNRAESFAINNNFVYLADYDGGLKVIDISDPYDPVLVNTIILNYNSQLTNRPIVRDNKLMIIDNRWNEIFVFDLNNPSQPQYVSSFRWFNYSNVIEMFDNYLYSSQDSNISILDFTEYLSDSNEFEITVPPFNLINYPNPFNPTTTIDFSIQNDSNVELTIYNIKGQKIKTLANNNFTQGSHSITWNGDDELGEPVSSGVYLYKLNVNGKTEAVKKCLLLK